MNITKLGGQAYLPTMGKIKQEADASQTHFDDDNDVKGAATYGGNEKKDDYLENEEEKKSPKYNGSDMHAAPKLRDRVEMMGKNDNLLYQLNMRKQDREKYFYNNYETDQLLPHYSSKGKLKKRLFVTKFFKVNLHNSN